MKNVKNGDYNITEISIIKEQIEKEADEIYPISIISDKKCEKLQSVPDWSELFYYKKPNIMKEKFIKLISNSEYAKFFDGLNYEYGLNNHEINIQKAFDIYSDAANYTTDTLSMCKMYYIYKNEYEKFNIEKRNRVLEKYYLFKCFSYLSEQELSRSTFLCNRFDVFGETMIHFQNEDGDFKKFNKLISHLSKYINYYNGITQNDLNLIEGVIIFKLCSVEEKRNKALQKLENLAAINNLEGMYKYGIFMLKKEREKGEFYMKQLVGQKYYRCFCDYAVDFYKSKNDSISALNLLKPAYENGIIRANYLYYDIFLGTFDFIDLKKNTLKYNDQIKNLFNLLINDIVTEGVYSFFEYFYFRKICIKHFNLKNLLDELFLEYTKAFTTFLIQITKTDNNENNSNDNNSNENNNNDLLKNKIKKIFQRDEFFSEFHLACGVLYYYGIENIIPVNLDESIKMFHISFRNSNSKSYKRFCYSFICKIRNKLVDKARYPSSTVTQEKLEKSKNKLLYLYKCSIDEVYISYLSSSFFYYLARLYHKKWGTQSDLLLEYIYLKRASEYNTKTPGTGTIISYYRKYKSILILNENENNIYKKQLYNIYKYDDSEGYGDDCSLCPICFEKERDMMFLPCKHLFCADCSKVIMEKCKCPICRGLIIYCFDYTKNQKEKNQNDEYKEDEKKENKEKNGNKK